MGYTHNQHVWYIHGNHYHHSTLSCSIKHTSLLHRSEKYKSKAAYLFIPVKYTHNQHVSDIRGNSYTHSTQLYSMKHACLLH